MLTSSFGWTSSPASVAITSFAFMFDDVPEPVWKTSIGNWSSSSPAATRSRGRGDPLGLVGVEQPELGVHARRGGLDPAEPARARRPGSARRRRGSWRPPCGSRRPRAPALVSGLAHGASLAEVLGDDASRASLGRAGRAAPPDVLVELALVRPADVAAARALGVHDPAARRAVEPVLLAAAEAFDDRRHTRTIGYPIRAATPILGEAIVSAAPRPSSSSQLQSLTRGRPCGSPAVFSRRVDRLPARVERPARRRARRGASSTSSPLRAPGSRPSRASSSSSADGLGRVLLVRADHAARAALDPAGAVRGPARRAPPSFGIVPRRSSNGTPGSATPR